MSFYSEMADTATGLLTEFGQSVTVTIKTSSVYDTSIAAMTVTTAEQTGIGAVFDYPSRDISGTLIKEGDKKLLLSVSGITITPSVDDVATIGSKSYTITQVKPISPAGEVVMYQCNIRGA